MPYTEVLNQMTETLRSIEQMPVLFVGHGSPLNAIGDNDFSRGWRAEQLLLAAGRLERSG